eukprot:s1506_g5.t1
MFRNVATAGYAFESTQCSQTGSLVYRLSMLYIYFAGCIYAVFTILGQIVRNFGCNGRAKRPESPTEPTRAYLQFCLRPMVMLNPEPWFFNPQTPDESIIFRLLRKVAP